VGTLPQELSSLQLTGEPVMVHRKKKPSGAGQKRQRKHEKANAAPQVDVGPGARGAHSGESCTGTDVDTWGSSRTKRPLSLGGTPQDAQSQVKHTKQKQKEAPYNLLRFLTSSQRFSWYPGKKYQGLYWGWTMGPSAAWFYEGQLRPHRNWNWSTFHWKFHSFSNSKRVFNIG